ncbi:TPA: hypothetical protein QEK88_000719 [Stenotrophomonas maltophilia]|nr:hypothetical protein [Stenotrophomonas maltophilia]
MKNTYDLYGAKGHDLYPAMRIAEATLGVIFEEKDSSYQGGVYYKFKGDGSENIVIKMNVDPFDGGVAEMEFPEHSVLLYVNSTKRSSELEGAIGRCGVFELLRREVL